MESTSNIIKGAKWIDLNVSVDELRPDMTLIMGQCFNWKELTNNNLNKLDQCWIGMLGPFPLAIRQTYNSTFFANLFPLINNNENINVNDIEANDIDYNTDFLIKFLNSYFQLDHNYSELYETWSKGCERMKVVTSILKGVRVCRQEPWECLISFICSSNNNIKRITSMLESLRIKYGNYVCSIQPSTISTNETYQWEVFYDPSIALNLKNNLDLKSNNNKRSSDDISSEIIDNTKTDINSNNILSLFTFPTVKSLAKSNEEDLRSLGMGYRAKFILGSALKIEDRNEMWLEDLRNINDRKEVQKQLCELAGVGPKVADCIALFSLDQTSVIPVDTHVLDISIRDYNVTANANRSVTPVLYDEVGNAFRIRFGEYCGWAHSVLFAAELNQFSILLPIEMKNEMKTFALERKEAKYKFKKERKIKKLKVESKFDSAAVKIEQSTIDNNTNKNPIKLERIT
jgi:N-glycosylase/DNA lyase